MILDGSFWEGIQEYIAHDANNIARVEDISGNIFLYPPQGHPILYNCLTPRTSEKYGRGGGAHYHPAAARWQEITSYKLKPYKYRDVQNLCGQQVNRQVTRKKNFLWPYNSDNI